MMVASRNVARRLWPQGGAVGSWLRARPQRAPGAEIVGVVGRCEDRRRSKAMNGSRSTARTRQNAFLSDEDGPGGAVLPVRGRALRCRAQAIRQLEPDQPVADPKPMNSVSGLSVPSRHALQYRAPGDLRADRLLYWRRWGVYGVVSLRCEPANRRNRAPPGAGRASARCRAPGSAQAAALGALGIAASAAAWALTRLMATMLYGMAPTDTYTFVAIPVLLGTVVLLAGYLPARRAMALDPAIALRHE